MNPPTARPFLAVLIGVFVTSSFVVGSLRAAEHRVAEDALRLLDVFDLEYASDPRISPDGERVVYVRSFSDVMTDRRRSNLWIVDWDGGDHRALATGSANYTSPRWSPDGDRLLYVSDADGGSQLWVRWMDTGQTAKLTNLRHSPSGIAWSPGGRWIAFSMFVPADVEPLASMPARPEGAEWADPPRVIEKLRYRSDGVGFLEDGYRHLFVLPVEGGTPRQVTTGDFEHSGAPSWSADGRFLIFSANRHADFEREPNNSEVYEVALADGTIRPLTDRYGPDGGPVVSPDGRHVAYLGYDDELKGFHASRVHLMNRDGSGKRVLTGGLDRSVQDLAWSPDGRGLYFEYHDRGVTHVGFVDLRGRVESVADHLGDATVSGRPYPGGDFTVARGGRFAYTRTDPTRPSDLAVGRRGSSKVRTLTALNEDLLAARTLGTVTEMTTSSSHDGLEIQSWVIHPPGFDPAEKYPLILEIHGGPFANYGPRFTPELQLYAAAGYVVVYANPRGSTSYGSDFANEIHHAYPGRDFDDLMSVIDDMVATGHVKEDELFVTGGSGGGTLTSWIVGHTDRFRAAVVQKPVINWYSFVLTADAYNYFYKYWFPDLPWNDPEPYLARSPIHHVGKVTTPTMLLTGEEDHRTPMKESEQFYQALQLRGVETALVRLPGASHGITRRPSQLIAKVTHVLAWFDRYREERDAAEDEELTSRD